MKDKKEDSNVKGGFDSLDILIFKPQKSESKAFVTMSMRGAGLKNLHLAEDDAAQFSGHEESYGKRLKKSIDTHKEEIPNSIPYTTVYISGAFYEQTNFQKHLLDLLMTTDCKLVHFLGHEKLPYVRYGLQNELEQLHETKIICLKDANPYQVIGCLTAAIKENKSKLGNFSILYDPEALEKVPEIGAYTKKVNQKGLSN